MDNMTIGSVSTGVNKSSYYPHKRESFDEYL